MSETQSGFFFKPRGEKALSRKPVCVLLPPEVDEYVRSLPNRTEWLREAIADKIKKDVESQSKHSGESGQGADETHLS